MLHALGFANLDLRKPNASSLKQPSHVRTPHGLNMTCSPQSNSQSQTRFLGHNYYIVLLSSSLVVTIVILNISVLTFAVYTAGVDNIAVGYLLLL